MRTRLIIIIIVLFFSCDLNSFWKDVNFKYIITGNSTSVSAQFLSNSGEVHGGNSGGSVWMNAQISSLPWDYDFTVRLSDICQSAILYATNNDIGSSITIAIYVDGRLSREADVAGGSSGYIEDSFCQ